MSLSQWFTSVVNTAGRHWWLALSERTHTPGMCIGVRSSQYQYMLSFITVHTASLVVSIRICYLYITVHTASLVVSISICYLYITVHTASLVPRLPYWCSISINCYFKVLHLSPRFWVFSNTWSWICYFKVVHSTASLLEVILDMNCNLLYVSLFSIPFFTNLIL